MAPSKPKPKKNKKRNPHPGILLQDAAAKLEAGQAAQAAAVAKRALDFTEEKGDFVLSALNLLGHIHVELGELDEARKCFEKAVALDEDGMVHEKAGGGPDKFLWLAQLSESGGKDSVEWFQRGVNVLRKQISDLDQLNELTDEQQASREEKQRKLGGTLCAVVEVYMTDLSWEDDAEQMCESLVGQAIEAAPQMPETWQTVANVRISQQRVGDAKDALRKSLSLWRGLPPEHDDVPDFPTRVSLTRLLLEVGLVGEALEVLYRLTDEDDESVEVWYLGGWALYLRGEETGSKMANGVKDGKRKAWASSRRWLKKCLHQYDVQDYEDDRLADHAKELLAAIQEELGEAAEGDSSDDDEDEWEDAEASDEEGDGDGDKKMEG